MDVKLEVVVVPVTDVDRAKAFYAEQLGFHVDVDHAPSPTFRNVQLTPPGSGCSVTDDTAMPRLLAVGVSIVGLAWMLRIYRETATLATPAHWRYRDRA